MSCVTCGKKSSTRCAKCHTTTYCSATCQTQDWREHKPQCADLEDLFVCNRIASLQSERKECHCAGCQSLCTLMPGAYEPWQVLEFVKRDPDFYSTCVEDYHLLDERPAFYL